MVVLAAAFLFSDREQVGRLGARYCLRMLSRSCERIDTSRPTARWRSAPTVQFSLPPSAVNGS